VEGGRTLSDYLPLTGRTMSQQIKRAGAAGQKPRRTTSSTKHSFDDRDNQKATRMGDTSDQRAIGSHPPGKLSAIPVQLCAVSMEADCNHWQRKTRKRSTAFSANLDKGSKGRDTKV
jgi:hypothetical protein